MTQVVTPLSRVDENEEDELKCSKCSESFRKRKHLKRHLTYSNCMDPDSMTEDKKDEVEEKNDEAVEASGNEPNEEEAVTLKEVINEEPENIEVTPDVGKDMDVSVLDESVDSLSDAVEAYHESKSTPKCDFNCGIK